MSTAGPDTIAPDFRMEYHVGTDPEVKYQVMSPDEAGISIGGSLRLYFDDIETVERLIEVLEAARTKMAEEGKLSEAALNL